LEAWKIKGKNRRVRGKKGEIYFRKSKKVTAQRGK